MLVNLTPDVYGRTPHPKEERKLDGLRAVTPASPREGKDEKRTISTHVAGSEI